MKTQRNGQTCTLLCPGLMKCEPSWRYIVTGKRVWSNGEIWRGQQGFYVRILLCVPVFSEIKMSLSFGDGGAPLKWGLFGPLHGRRTREGRKSPPASTVFSNARAPYFGVAHPKSKQILLPKIYCALGFVEPYNCQGINYLYPVISESQVNV